MLASGHLHFVTGKLAEPMVRHVVSSLADQHHFSYTIDVLPITVAALMTPKWLLRHVQVPSEAAQIILPGYLADGLEELQAALPIPVACGPKDIRDLPEMFREGTRPPLSLDAFSIEIIAEINHAPRLSVEQLLGQARELIQQGADRIDLGCDPATRWTNISDAVRALTSEGIRTSIDTFDPWEAAAACKAGSTLVLSVHRESCNAAVDWGTEVVIVPSNIENYEKDFDATINALDNHRIAFRLDPILEPIGTGFAESLQRYYQTRQRYPNAKMLMGIGNLTELTDVDSAGVNAVLMGLCEELRIESVLTTQVINWSRTCVRECDVARRIMHYAVQHRTPPKRVDDRLVMLRDPKLKSFPENWIDELCRTVRDNNFRILIDHEQIHLIRSGLHLTGTDPFEIMQLLMQQPDSQKITPEHSFYLGYELSKAKVALTLGKNYEQDESLRWGLCTQPEKQHHLKPRKSS